MRRLIAASMCVIGVVAPALANTLEAERDNVLQELEPERVAQRRATCALGQAPAARAPLVEAGFNPLPVGAYCVTVLTRIGRDGTLGYVRDPNSPEPTSAITFDTGFVSGFLKREILPADAPSMATLLPIADRCLGQDEPNMRLCTLAGQVLGSRAASGELVPVS
jgi:hypothetical protein